MNHHLTSFFEYNEESPSCLVWAEGAMSTGKGSAERKRGSVAGSLMKGVWQVQVIIDGLRERSTASRVVWELHNGQIPAKHYISFRNGDSTDCRIDNLICIDHRTLQHTKMWWSGKAYVNQGPYGAFYTMMKPHGYIGSYDTHKEAHDAYRSLLEEVLAPLGLSKPKMDQYPL